jgi:hypothetical protein
VKLPQPFYDSIQRKSATAGNELFVNIASLFEHKRSANVETMTKISVDAQDTQESARAAKESVGDEAAAEENRNAAVNLQCIREMHRTEMVQIAEPQVQRQQNLQRPPAADVQIHQVQVVKQPASSGRIDSLEAIVADLVKDGAVPTKADQQILPRYRIHGASLRKRS